jgi:signal transduction histidine kinase
MSRAQELERRPSRLGGWLMIPVRAVLNAFKLIMPNAEPGALYRRVRLAQVFLPPLIALVVVFYQLYIVHLPSLSGAFWLELGFYGIVGPLVTYYSIGWIGVEVQEREKAERDLRGLYLELSESHRRLAAIQQVTKQVSEANDLASTLETAIKGLTEAVGATAGAIALESGIVRTVGMGDEPSPLEVFDLEPVRSASATLERPSGWAGATNRLSVPLRWGDRFLGAVHAYFQGMPRAEAKELLEILVGELSAAIEATEHRTRDLLTVFEVDRSIRAESNLERLLEAVLGRIGARVSASAAAVYLADDGDRLTLAWGRDVHGQRVRGYEAGRLALQVAHSRTPVLLDDLEAAPEFDGGADPVLEGARSAVGLPMLSDTELVGVIVLADERPNAFDPNERPLLGLLANQVTLAVRNARAYLYSEELAILDERSRIAREIHDGIAQSLAFTALKLDLAGRLLGRDNERVKLELETAKNTLREQIREVRRSIFALRPIDLERLGFLEAVRFFVRDFGEQHGIRTELEQIGDPMLSPTNEAVAFRILQEALNNVAKHSRAKTARVTLRSDANGTSLTVQDDGEGFDPDALTGMVTSAGGLGLLQMRERVESRGGQFGFSSKRGEGTRVTASLPTG